MNLESLVLTLNLIENERKIMRKLLLLLLGLLLIAFLATIAFTNEASDIEKDLISKTKLAYSENDVANIEINIVGDEYEMTRIITLSGNVQTEEEKDRAEFFAEGVNGVCDINNEIFVLGSDIEVSPYTLSVTKNKAGQVVLDGFVNAQYHADLVEKAKNIFGEGNVEDNLKNAKGDPEAWFETSLLGLKMLESVENGGFEVIDDKFSFDGGVTSLSQKELLADALKSGLHGSYVGSFNIEVFAKETAFSAKEGSPTTEDKAVVSAMTCQSQFESLLSKDKIRFGYGSVEISSGSFPLLDSLIVVMAECPDANVIIGGYSDSVGSDKFNLKLSDKRAKKVKQYLVQKGVSSDKLTAIGYGEASPIADNNTEDGREQNRRIEFNIKGIK